MIHRQATNADLRMIKELLNISKLPSDDCVAHIGREAKYKGVLGSSV